MLPFAHFLPIGMLKADSFCGYHQLGITIDRKEIYEFEYWATLVIVK